MPTHKKPTNITNSRTVLPTRNIIQIQQVELVVGMNGSHCRWENILVDIRSVILVTTSFS